jgi:hypothetical protein
MVGGHVVVDGWPLQILAPPGDLGEEALLMAQAVDVEGIPVRVLRAEHLAALALQTGRAKDHLRLAELVQYRDFDMKQFNAIIDRFGLQALWDRFNSG